MPRDTTSALTLARRILQTASADVESTEAAALSDEPDGLHQHRISVRRLRSVAKALASTTSTGQTRELSAALAPWGRTLGEARDAEVRADRAEKALAECGIDDADARRRLVGDERAAYRHLHDRVVEENATEAGRTRTRAVREAGLRFDLDDPEVPAQKVVRRLLRAEVRRVSRAARRSDDSLERLHAVRKAARRTRYLAEAIDRADSDVVGADGRRLGRAAKRIHKLLGEHRDELLLADRATRLRGRAFTAQEETGPYDAVAGAASARAAEHLERLPKALEKLKKAAKRVS
ncbi:MULTISPECIES: CHAD domain-containing protein [Microbacterium]|uniref:CHAD domain-containing protein n=1 Tax=Microbacterium TaxID=33882 RepID=UPI0027848360|nr:MULTISPECIES: CHAD domain-containing protein [Microbacterium]MDQ1082358.1 CHAD domain-containing protein [Microbacterium sp. SORGH_AS_0344]MDQ1168871.1 CHAD domain-containing protein [Microbacterium proteolyticum]